MMAAHITHPLPGSSSQAYTSSTYSRYLASDKYNYDLDEDLPPCPQPVPHATVSSSDALDLSDPLLCLTPEKPARKELFGSFKNRSLDSSKGSQKVRFDSTVEVKTLSPQNTSTETSNIDTTQSSSLTDSSAEQVERSGSSYLPGDSTFFNSSSDSKSSTSYSTIQSDDLDFVNVLATDLESKASLIYGKRQHKKTTTVRTSIWGEDGLGDNVLARPEFNSTIMMRRELEGLKDKELDVNKAIKEKLAVSEALRNKVTEKACLKLNSTKSSPYDELISLDVREEEVISRVEKEKSAKVRAPKVRSQEMTVPGPDIMEFFSPDLQRETASYSLHGIPPVECAPRTADASHAFDVYRHIRAWEGW